ncbi:MAG: endonuclease/exonuclease/phosphatase family protein [Clostridia bacterium]
MKLLTVLSYVTVTTVLVIISLILMFLTACTGVQKDLSVSAETSSAPVEVRTVNISKEEVKQKTIKLMTYNIRHGVGIDNHYDLDRVIQVIKEADPDIVSLNEIDHMIPRTFMQKQDSMIAEGLGYNFVFGYNINFGSKYGNVLLSKHPIKTYINHSLPKDNVSEPRGLIEADIDIDGETIKVFSTHLSIVSAERPKQVEYIKEKLEEIQETKIMMGDFNALPDSDEIKQIREVMQDSAREEYKTFSSDSPYARIDYIFVSEEIQVQSSEAIESEASDHFPVVAEVVLIDKD